MRHLKDFEHNYYSKHEIKRSNIQDRIFIAAIVMLMAILFGGLMSSCNLQRQQLIEEHNWSSVTVSDIEAGVVRIGMTKDMVRAAWGTPININYTVTQRSSTEQWVYQRLYSYAYVYFDDSGKVTTIQR